MSSGDLSDEYFFGWIDIFRQDHSSRPELLTRFRMRQRLIKVSGFSEARADQLILDYSARNKFSFPANSVYEEWLDEFKRKHEAAGEPLEYDELLGKLVYETGLTPNEAKLWLQEYCDKNNLPLKPLPHWIMPAILGSLVSGLLIWIVGLLLDSRMNSIYAIAVAAPGALGIAALLLLLPFQGWRFRKTRKIRVRYWRFFAVWVVAFSFLSFQHRIRHQPWAAAGVGLLIAGLAVHQFYLIHKNKAAWQQYGANKLRIGNETLGSMFILGFFSITLIVFSAMALVGIINLTDQLYLFLYGFLYLPKALNINAKIDGITPLMKAVINGDSDTVRLLLQSGADQRQLNPERKDALEMAEARNLNEIAAVLRDPRLVKTT